jgi:hypothetical protein
MCSVHINTLYFVFCCGPPTGVIYHSELPVFKPNDFFWENHWKPNQDKEEKWQTFARVVRKIIMKQESLKETSIVAEDRFEFLKNLHQLKDIKCD